MNLTMSLSSRRSQMATRLRGEDHNDKAADFDYRRDVSNDIEVLLRDAGVFSRETFGGGQKDDLDRTRKLRDLADDLTKYIVS